MKEFKILAVVVFFSLVTYWGVEPFAHSQMHKYVEDENFAYADLPALVKSGDVTRGKDLVMGAGACIGCHSLKAEGIANPLDPVTAAASYGVNPPDLSKVGGIFDANFLAALLKNPTEALALKHKFDDIGKAYPMPAFYGAGGDIDQEIADMVAYLQSIAGEVTPAEAFEVSCGRCHANRYTQWTQLGTVPQTKPNIVTGQDIEMLQFKTGVAQYQDHMAKYLGKLPPDLSMIIRARSEEYLSTFVQAPQSQLPGTGMPRVGLSKDGYEKVISYLEESGDPSKPKRESLGPWVLGFFVIFSILAYLWKNSVWRDLH